MNSDMINFVLGMILVFSGFIVILSLMLLIKGIINFNRTPGVPAKRPGHYPSAQEIAEMNREYAAKRAKSQVETVRGKLLEFNRKPWYKSSYKDSGRKKT